MIQIRKAICQLTDGFSFGLQFIKESFPFVKRIIRKEGKSRSLF
jgi:hypothetical protein